MPSPSDTDTHRERRLLFRLAACGTRHSENILIIVAIYLSAKKKKWKYDVYYTLFIYDNDITLTPSTLDGMSDIFKTILVLLAIDGK